MKVSKKDNNGIHSENATPGTHRIIVMTPEEEKGTVISYARYESLHGRLLIASTARGIAFIGFGEPQQLLSELKKRYPTAQITPDEKLLHRQALALVDDPRREEPLPLHIKGTTFQLAVWQELLEVPCGTTTSYGTLAHRIGRPTAARAVGSAVGRNPVACLIPCHRVLQGNNSMGGYHWGTALKAQLLRIESAQPKQTTVHTIR